MLANPCLGYLFHPARPTSNPDPQPVAGVPTFRLIRAQICGHRKMIWPISTQVVPKIPKNIGMNQTWPNVLMRADWGLAGK